MKIVSFILHLIASGGHFLSTLSSCREVNMNFAVAFRSYPSLAYYFPPILINGRIITLEFLYRNAALVHSAYVSILLLVSTVLLLQFGLRHPRPFLWQAGALSIGVLAPWIGDSLSNGKLITSYYPDLVPLAFVVIEYYFLVSN